AYLPDVLADYQVTIPELGPIRAPAAPIGLAAPNRRRESHDALKGRRLHYRVDYPPAGRGMQILKVRCPKAGQRLSRPVAGFVQELRKMDLFKLPGVAETIDWTHALMQLDAFELDRDTVNDTLGTLLKYQDDIARIQGSEANRILNQVKAELA